jgi:hypothetical protein
MKWLFAVLMVLNVGYFAVEGYLRMATPEKELLIEEELIAEEKEVVAQCLYLDFKNDQFMGAAYKKLAGSGISVEHKSYFTSISKEYWLIEGPFENSASANDQVKKLLLKNIDSFVLNNSEFKNTLSFGVFSSKKKALKVQSDLSLNQVEARLKLVEDSSEDKWLKISSEDVYKVESSWLSRLQNDYFLEKNVKKSCK